MKQNLSLITPGEVLLEEFLKPIKLTQNALARALSVPPGRVNDIVLGRRVITRDTAARLAIYFSTTPDFWLNLQCQFDAKIASRDIMPKVAATVRPPSAA